MIKLNDILKLTNEELSTTKIRLNTISSGNNPIDIYKQDPDALLEWNYYNNKSYAVGDISIGLVNMGNCRWLLFTVGRITKLLNDPINSTPGKKGGVQVEYETLTQYEDLFGRTIISFHNNSQQMMRRALSIGKADRKARNNITFMDKMVISEILPSVYDGFEFPGYDNVSLSFSELATIVNGNHPSYKNALETQKAVYLQTDKATGKLYVGSATAKSGMLLARWTSYVKNGHGGNKALKALIDDKGFGYVKENFQYTIIENFNSKEDDQYVLKRESYWKEVLQTRVYGYNEN